MKIIKYFISLLTLLLIPSAAFAYDVRIPQKGISGFVLAADQTIDDNLVVFAPNIEIAGRVNGDAIVFASEKIKITGSISGNILVAAPTVELTGTVTKDAIIFGDVARLEKTGQINRDAVVFANKINRDSEMKIGRKSILKTYTPTQKTFSARNAILKVIFNVVVLSILGGLILWLLPKPLRVAAETIKGEFVKSFLIGLAATILGPIVVLILLFSIIGWLSAVVLAIILYLLIVLAPVLAGIILGEFLLQKKYPALISLILGLLIYQIIILTPYLGPMVVIVVMIAGLGGGIMTLYRSCKA